jgi:hypothetical protein
MIDPRAFEVAAIRHAEILEQAAQYRLARRDASPHSGRRRWSQALRDAVAALRVTGSATRRPGLTKPVDLAPAAETA